ncbi:MAG: DUF1573 domain-containing protein [Saprospiraceae bacterium]|nr:DUF1573 domain-containing protein [Saprospiraceae bacterium]
MKNSLFFLIIMGLGWSACKNDGESVKEIRDGNGPNSSMVRNPASANLPLDTNQLARITYAESEFEFGEVKEGDIVEHQFKFTNTGKVPLIILNARSSCGCTIPEWPHDPVPPGASGVITAKFNTEGKIREQKKLIYITANTYPNETKVALHGMVISQ